MTPVQSPSAPPQLQQQQQILNGIAARLAQLAKESPDLAVYLKAHAECITTLFRPVGFAYEMRSGLGFQRVLQHNLESLAYKESPEQENAFQRARKLAAEQRSPVFLAPKARESMGLHGLPPTDSPAPDELAMFNDTPFDQIFVPIPLNDTVAGVLHIWLQPVNGPASNARVSLLRQLCNEIELYLKNRRSREISQEVERLTTYARLLEELTGDIELDSVSWKLVNYAREAVACERVCLFVATDYDRALKSQTTTADLEYHFQLQACSGLKRPHPKSEQAVVLQHVAQKLTEMSLDRTGPENAASPVSNAASPPTVPPATAAPTKANEERKLAGTPNPKPADAKQPKLQLTLVMRDPSKTATRASEINDYFDLMPMNWATVIPLFDHAQRVCGILLFEGVKIDEKLGNSFKPMLELAISAGRCLGTTLYCNQNRSMRLARRFVALHQEYVNTPAKRKWLRFGVPILALVAILACPFPYSVKGNASVLPVTQNTLPALVGARLVEVNVREGDAVKKDQILARFDSSDIQLQFYQARQEEERARAESDSYRNLGNVTQMAISERTAEKAAAMAEKWRQDLNRAIIRAPFDGLVLGAQTLSTRVGEVLRPGETALQVVDPSSWQVKASLKERDLIFLDQRLHQNGVIPGSLRLAANPAYKYQLELAKKDQLAYGLDTSTGQYQFTAMLPLKSQIESASLLKAGFTGQVTFEAGTRSLAYVLFKDFFDYLTVRFF